MSSLRNGCEEEVSIPLTTPVQPLELRIIGDALHGNVSVMKQRRLDQILYKVELGAGNLAELTLDDGELTVLNLLGTVLEIGGTVEENREATVGESALLRVCCTSSQHSPPRRSSSSILAA